MTDKISSEDFIKAFGGGVKHNLKRPQGDLISREALKEVFTKASKDYNHEAVITLDCALATIDNAPPVQPLIKPIAEIKVEARPQGEWEDVICEKGGFYHATCSNCKIRNDIPPVDFAHFCPNCGADMRGGSDNE